MQLGRQRCHLFVGQPAKRGNVSRGASKERSDLRVSRTGIEHTDDRGREADVCVQGTRGVRVALPFGRGHQPLRDA